MNPSVPTLSIIGYSEIENIVKESFNGILWDLAGKSNYLAILDDDLFARTQENLKHKLMFNGINNIQSHLNWWHYYHEEVIFPRIIERTSLIRKLGVSKRSLDWRFDDGCCLVS